MADNISKKSKINMLSPIDNIFGTHEGRLGPVMIYLGTIAAPFIVWLFSLSFLIPFKFFIIAEILWAVRMWLIIIGKEKEKKEEYRTSKRNKYASAKTIIKIAHCYDNGLLEYENGRINVVVTGFTRTYYNDNVYSADMKDFLSQLDKYTPDVYLHQVSGENNLQDTSERLKIYSDKDLMSQRMGIYELNDAYVNENSKLWRFSFSIKASKYNWKTTVNEIEAIIDSETAKKVFFHIEIADRLLVSDIASRDLCTHVAIEEMLRQKYSNDDYDDSRVLYYGDDVPDEYKEQEDGTDLENRRVVLDEDDEY